MVHSDQDEVATSAAYSVLLFSSIEEATDESKWEEQIETQASIITPSRSRVQEDYKRNRFYPEKLGSIKRIRHLRKIDPDLSSPQLAT